MISTKGISLFNLMNTSYISSRNIKRWVRKPLGSPVAKTKIFRIPVKPNIPDDEKYEIKRLYDNYKNEMKSLRQYFFEQSLKQAESGEVAQMKIKLEEEEHNRLMMLNQEENARIAQLREERLKQQAKKVAERVLSSLLKKEEEKKIFEGKVESFLESQQKLPFIDPANIEREIEIALANPVNHNFAIDLEGYIYTGKEVQIDKIPEDQRKRLSV